MKKQLVSIALVLIMALGLFSVTALAVNASPTAATVLVNGKNVAFDAYNINGNNYFKLRDLAYTLNGTVKQFEVGYDNATRAITLTSCKSYTADGSEMTSKGAGNKEASPTTSKIYKDGKEVQFTAYNIGGNNYFKLRDIGEAFDFDVVWDGAAQTIRIDTSKGYTPETAAPTPTPTPTPSGNTDSALIGHWTGSGYSGGYYYSEMNHWFFFEDGRIFFYKITGSMSLYGYSANYSVSGGRIYFTNVVFANDGYQEGFRKDEPDSYVDYKIVVEYDTNLKKDIEWLKIDNTGGSWTGSPNLKRASMAGFENIGW